MQTTVPTSDTRPIAPPTHESWSALQRGQYLHMLRDAFDILTTLHTAPLYSASLRQTIRVFMDTSIRCANTYRLPPDFDLALHAKSEPFRATVAHITDVAALTTNTALDDDDACGLIYVRTATLIQSLYPEAFCEWLHEVGERYS